MESVNNIKPKKSTNFFVLFLTALLFLSIGIMGSIYVIKQKPDLIGLDLNIKQSPVEDETEKLIKEVALLMTLPEYEKPAIASVTDVDKLKDQKFFSQAKNGDRILIYQKAKRAILYRPSEKRIIEVGVVNINQPEPTPVPTQTAVTPTPSPTQIPTIVTQ